MIKIYSLLLLLFPFYVTSTEITDSNIRDAVIDHLQGELEDTHYGDTSTWNTSQVTNLNNLCNSATYTIDSSLFNNFNANLSQWNTSNVTNMLSTFANAQSFNSDIGAWDTSQVITMGSMFFNANSFNQNLNSWNVKKVTNMIYMFYGATGFNQDVCWDIQYNDIYKNEIFVNSNGKFSDNCEIKTEAPSLSSVDKVIESSVEEDNKPDSSGNNIGVNIGIIISTVLGVIYVLRA